MAARGEVRGAAEVLAQVPAPEQAEHDARAARAEGLLPAQGIEDGVAPVLLGPDGGEPARVREVLVADGADVNAIQADGATALHWAARASAESPRADPAAQAPVDPRAPGARCVAGLPAAACDANGQHVTVVAAGDTLVRFAFTGTVSDEDRDQVLATLEHP